MKYHTFMTPVIIFAALTLSMDINATVDDDAEVVQLRQSCEQAGGTITIPNCFTDMNALDDWIWDTRNPQPSAASPLSVEIGPGVFTGQFSCTDKGHVALRGAGIGSTTLENLSPIIVASNCNNLTFSHMTIRNTSPGLIATLAVGGSTYWNNIEIDARGFAWVDSPSNDCTIASGKHYWYSSRISVNKVTPYAYAYYNACDETWVFGSEITATADSADTPVIPVFAGSGKVYIHGSVIRALTEPGVSGATLTPAKAINDAEIHIHGTGIDAISPGAGTIVALSASNTSKIHANASSYVLQTGTGGTVTRISENDSAQILAPYLWKEGISPPDIVSTHGSDMAITTDTLDDQPHIVVYTESTECTSNNSNWFDTTTGSCK